MGAWEILREITQPYCIRAEDYHIVTLFEQIVDDKGQGFDLYTKLSKWVKCPLYPTEVWLN